MNDLGQLEPLLHEAAGGANPGSSTGAADATSEAAEAERYAFAIERLRHALAATDPGISPELLTGDTVEEVEARFTAVRESLAAAREQARREAAAAIPAGAPGRTAALPSTPFAKIREGLVRRGA